MRSHRAAAVSLALLLVTGAAACGGDDDDDAADSTTTTEVADDATTTTEAEDDATTTTEAEEEEEATTTTAAEAEPMTILVSNDDGYQSAGIDALVEALAADTTIEVVVSAPADDQSGSGDATTPGPLEAIEGTTLSGHPATAVRGEPADSVLYGLDTIFAGTVPDLVVSGINAGQNLGPVVDLSGTIGAARVAARRGIPAVAISQGITGEGVPFDYATGVEVFMTWFTEHRDQLAEGDLVNINIPTCDPGTELRGTLEVASGADADIALALQVADCASTLTPGDLTDDVTAFNAGFAAITEPGLGE